jgi:hypothetical protein
LGVFSCFLKALPIRRDKMDQSITGTAHYITGSITLVQDRLGYFVITYPPIFYVLTTINVFPAYIFCTMQGGFT